MGILDFLKKKPASNESLDLPPPPAPDSALQPAEFNLLHELPSMDQLPESVPIPTYMPEPPAEAQAEEQQEPTELPAEAEHEDVPAYAPPATSLRDEPLFVSVTDYQEVLTSINYVRAKLGEADRLVHKLNEIKSLEEKSFEAWRNQLEDVQRKLAYVENVVFEAGV
jgi:hypothetical protein